jgi:sugar transferase (PEP-CTERM/EpsH1 system associated)
MKLLYLAHRVPYPPNKGDKIRSYHELLGFIERGHEVHLIAFADDSRDLSHQVLLERRCASAQIVPLHCHMAKWRALTRLVNGQPLSLGYFASRAMKRLVGRSIEKHDFDVVFVFSSSMAQYVPRHLSSRAIIDLVDVDSEKWREYARQSKPPLSWLYNLEWRRLRKYEYQIIARFAHSILTTQREAALLSELDEFTRRARLRVITNGVDLDYYQREVRVDHSSRPARPRLVFIGAMDYYANIEGVRWFVDKIFPLIRLREPETEFFIVGSRPPREIEMLNEREGVRVTGDVDDVRPYLKGATCCVIPLRIARGIQNKVLEAMAASKAIVATPESVAGLRVENGMQLLIAREEREFGDAVLRVIEDPALRDRLALQSRRFVEIEHDWEPVLQQIVELAESVALRWVADCGEINHKSHKRDKKHQAIKKKSLLSLL